MTVTPKLSVGTNTIQTFKLEIRDAFKNLARTQALILAGFLSSKIHLRMQFRTASFVSLAGLSTQISQIQPNVWKSPKYQLISM